MLDALGDLTLSGYPIFGHFTSFRGGHKLNSKLISELLSSNHYHEICNLRDGEEYKLLGYKYESGGLRYKATG